MGLAGGIVRRVFSKNPCSSAGTGSRAHSEKGSAADHRRRWSSLRLYLCGEEMNAAADEEDDDGDGETVSDKSFETTCCVMPPEEAHVVVVPAVAHHRHRLTSDAHDDAADNDNPVRDEPAEDQSSRVVLVPGDGEQSHGHVIVIVVPTREEERAATLIQSAFRGFMARRQLRDVRARQEQEEIGGAQDWASVATSVLVQVGEEQLSNLRLNEESASVSVQQSSQRSSRPPPAPAFRVKEEWDDSTVSSNVSRMRIQSRIEATTRRERALAYAFSQQLRSCGGGGSKKRTAARAEQQGEYNNVGWSWLERWMATRQAAEPVDDCMSRNADTGSATTAGHRRVVVVRRRSNNNDLAAAVEEKESCGSNDVVSFDGSSSLGGARSGLSSSCCHNHKPPPGGKSRLKGAAARRKQVAASDHHRFQARSHKVSKKGHHRLDAGGFVDFDDACQPPTDY